MKNRLPIAVLIAAVLRLYDLGGQSYWTDEAISLEVAHWSWRTLFAYFQVDPHPPLFYLLVRGLVFLGFYGETSLRLLSALAGIGTVWAIGAYLSRRFGEQAAWFGALFLAVNPLSIWISQELRGMALAGFFLSLGLLAGQLFKQSPRRRWFWLSIFAYLAASYTHYFALFIIPVLLLGDRPARRTALISSLIFSPWLFFILRQWQSARAYRPSVPLWRQLAETVLYTNAGHFPWRWPTWCGLLEHWFIDHFFLYLAGGLLLSLPLAILVLLGFRHDKRLLASFLFPLFFSLFLARLAPVFQVKYLAMYLPFLLATAGIGTAMLSKRSRIAATLLFAFVVANSLLNLADHYENPLYRKPPWRDVLPLLTASLTAQDRVVIYSAQDAKDFRYYFNYNAPSIYIINDFTQLKNGEFVGDSIARLFPEQTLIRKIIVVDLNGELYQELRTALLSELTRQRGAPLITEIQPAMGIRWLEFSPPKLTRSCPSSDDS